MKVRIKSDEFPSKNAWLSMFRNSIYYKGIESILSVMYNCLYVNANTLGFSLVRYEFEECIIILQNQYSLGWVLEIDIKP